MMLGKPVVAHINDAPDDNGKVPEWIDHCPVVRATTETVYDVLKDLILSPDKRKKVGDACREYVIRYNAVEACADRFEMVYDSLMENRPVPEFQVDTRNGKEG